MAFLAGVDFFAGVAFFAEVFVAVDVFLAGAAFFDLRPGTALSAMPRAVPATLVTVPAAARAAAGAALGRERGSAT